MFDFIQFVQYPLRFIDENGAMQLFSGDLFSADGTIIRYVSGKLHSKLVSRNETSNTRLPGLENASGEGVYFHTSQVHSEMGPAVCSLKDESEDRFFLAGKEVERDSFYSMHPSERTYHFINISGLRKQFFKGKNTK